MIFGASRPRRPRSASRVHRDAPGRDDSTQLPPKLIPTLKQFAATAASIVHTRISLAGLELEEEVGRLVSAAAMGVVALMLASLALIVGTFTIIAAVPIEYRVPTMISITVIYLVIALVLVLRVKGLFSNRPPMFAATLAELEKDKAALAQMAHAYEAEEAANDQRAAAPDDDAYRSASASAGQGAA